MADNLLDKASILLTPTAYDNGSMLSIKPENGDGDFDFQRNSAATRVNAQGLVENVQIISSELVSNGNFSQIGTEEVLNGNFSQQGSELVTNGDFSDGLNGWNFTAFNSVEIQNNKLKLNINDGTVNAAIDTTGTDVFGVNEYKVEFDYDFTNLNVSRFDIVIRSGNTIYYSENDSTRTQGKLTKYLNINNSGRLRINIVTYDSLSSYATIDNVSVKEVGQNWDLGTGWSIGDDKVEADGTSAFLIQSDFQSVASVKSYKIQYEVLSTNGVNIRFGGGSSMFGTPTLDTASIGVKTFYLQSNGTVKNLQFQNNLGFIGSVTNISVKEVGQDWTLSNGSISDKYNASMTAYQSGIKISPFVKTGTFKVVFDLVVTSGSCKFDAGGGNDEIYTTSGTKEKIITNPTKFEFNAFNLGWVGSLDNVSVKEITDDTNIPRINYEGFSYQDVLGSEEVVNGDFSNGSTGWIGDDATLDVSNNTGKVIVTSNAEAGIKTSGVSSFTQGKKYKLTFDVVSATGGLVSGTIKEYSNANVVGSWNGVGSYTISFTYRSSSSQLRWLSSSNVGDILEIDNVSVKEVLGQEVVPNSGCGSWLLEPQRTNLITYSEDFNQWGKINCTVTSNSIVSPDGTQNADKLIATSGASNKVINQIVPTNTYTASVFAKKGEFEGLFIGTGTVGAFFNLNTHTFRANYASAPTSYKIEEYGNGWYRYSITFTISSSDNLYIAPNDNVSNTLAITGNGANGIYIYGAQAEVGTYSTSYIPTDGATNTRLQDIANNSGNSSLINSTEGVLYAEIQKSLTSSLFDLGLYGSSASKQVRIGWQSNNVYATVYDGAIQAQMVYSNTLSDFTKIAFKYKENDFALWINGVEVATDSSGSTFSSGDLIKLNFSAQDGTSYPFHGKNKTLAVYKEALTDAELQSLTTI